MSWQKCPICNGAGWTGIGYPTGETCTVCQGRKIISVVSGLPPAYEAKPKYPFDPFLRPAVDKLAEILKKDGW